jgi:hypothetical protein
LALGLKKETADMGYLLCGNEYAEYPLHEIHKPSWDRDIPAWSLHRLLSLIPKEIEVKNPYRKWICFNMNFDYNIIYFQGDMEDFIGFYEGNIYDKAISCIEWLIKEGYFNEEYLNKEE